MIDIDELERLYGAATGGEWKGEYREDAGAQVRIQGEHTAEDGIWDTLMFFRWHSPFSPPSLDEQDTRDAVFVATAHNLMPEIIAELRSLRKDKAKVARKGDHN